MGAKLEILRNYVSMDTFSCSLKMFILYIRASINNQKTKPNPKISKYSRQGWGWGGVFSIVGYFWGLGRMLTSLHIPACKGGAHPSSLTFRL